MKFKTGIQLLAALLALTITVIKAQSRTGNYATRHKYTATRNGKEIGWLRCECIQRPGEISITTESSLFIQVIFPFEAKAITANKFNGAALSEAMVYRTLNNKVKLDNQVQFVNGQYKVIKGECKNSVTKQITSTSTSVYFKEPVGETELFSEVYLCLLKLEKIAASVYQVNLPDGGVMTYHYALGKLVRVIAKTSYATVYFDLEP